MKPSIAIGFACLFVYSAVATSSLAQGTMPPERELRITPEVRLRLPSESTELKPTIEGLNEIFIPLAKKQTADLKVTTEIRRSVEEADRRLLEVAREAGGKRAFVNICGWPALERQYSVKLAQPMETSLHGPPPEAPVVQAATIAIAEHTTLIRFDALLPPGVGAQGMAPIFALVQGISCPANPNPDATKAVIEKLKQELSQTPVSGERRELRTLPAPEAALGPSWSEIQIAASADGKTVVVGSNGGTAFSSNYGDSFSPSSTFTFSRGDPTLARGASGRFYLSGVNITASACTIPVAVNASGNGALFALTGTAASCPTTGSSCFPDQPQMAADGINSGATGDQLYIARREFSPWLIYNGCRDMPFGSGSPVIGCSSDDGTTWGHDRVVGAGDFGRIAVGSDGFVYVTFASGSNVMLSKFSSCDKGLLMQSGFPVVVAAFAGIDCPIDGLDRCLNDATASPQPAVSIDFPHSVFVAYAEKNGAGSNDIVVRHSRDGGLTWPDRTVANTAIAARRFLPWICAGSNDANVSWYDRRFANATDDSLTDYFFNTTSGFGVGTEVDVSGVSDSQKTGAIPSCPVGFICSPKYGDYNGNACTRDRVYVGWASATPPRGVVSTKGLINVFVQAIPSGPPLVTSVTPAQAQCGSGPAITIAGANFRGVSRVQLQTLNLTVPVSSFTVSSSSSMTATLPPNLAGGVYEVVVLTATGSSVQPALPRRTDLFSVLPTVTGLSPNSGPASGATQIAVSGSCFEAGSHFQFGSISAQVNQCLSSTQCTVYSPAAGAAATVDVVADNGGAQSVATPSDVFTYVGPQITSLSPASGPVSGGTEVQILGSGFPPYDGQNPVYTPMTFGASRTVAQFCDRTWCLVTTPGAISPGPVDVIATAFGTNSDVSIGDVFTYTAKPKLVRFETFSTYGGEEAVVGLDGYAPAGGAPVVLSSANQSLVSPASPISIAPGQISGEGWVTINPTPTSQEVVLTASYDGTSLTSTVNAPASPALTIAIDGLALDAGQSTDVTVGINTPAPSPGGALVTLSSSSPAAIFVPAAITIVAGHYTASFPITNQYTSGPSLVTISASYNGASASESIVVFTPPPKCAPKQCSELEHWDANACRCEPGPPQH